MRTEMQATPDPRAQWQDALLAARLLSIAGHELGGIRLRAGSGPVRDAWFDSFAAMTGADRSIIIPVASSMERLCGGLDVSATLTTGKIKHQTGLLAKSNGGFAIISGAERLQPTAMGAIISAMELGVVEPAITATQTLEASKFGLVAVDEAAPGETGLAQCQALS